MMKMVLFLLGGCGAIKLTQQQQQGVQECPALDKKIELVVDQWIHVALSTIVPGATMKDCKDYCEKNTKCKAWAWSRQTKGVCEMSEGKGLYQKGLDQQGRNRTTRFGSCEAFEQKFNEHMKDVVALLKQINVKPENTVLYLRATAGARSEETGEPLPKHLQNMEIINNKLLKHTFGTLAEIPKDAAEILEDKMEGSMALETMKDFFRRNIDKDQNAKWAMGGEDGCGSPGCKLVSMEQGGKSAQICDHKQCKYSSMIANMGMNALWKKYMNTCGLEPNSGSFVPENCKKAIETDLLKVFPQIKNKGRYVLFGGWYYALKRIGMNDGRPRKFEDFLKTINEKLKETGECEKEKPVNDEKEGKNCLDIVLLQVMLQEMMKKTKEEKKLKSAQIVTRGDDAFGWTAALMRKKQKEMQKNIVLIDAGSSSSKVWYLQSGGDPKKLEYEPSNGDKPSNMQSGLFT